VPPTSEQDNDAANRPKARPFRVGAAPKALRLTLAADWISPSVARTRLRDWLEAHRWPEEEVGDLVLAISEAVSNSVEHGYGITAADVAAHAGLVEVTARVERAAGGARCVELTVRDFGDWREPAPGPTTRGHGLLLMRSAAVDVQIHPSGEGTLIRLRSKPVAEFPAAEH